MQPEKLIEKIDQMKQNTLALELELFSLTFEKIGEKIEEIEKEFKAKDQEFEPLSDQNLQYRENLERLKELYFEVLFEIEAIDPSLLNKKPEEISFATQTPDNNSKLVKQYLDIAQYFKNDFKEQNPISAEQKNKIIGQNLCFAAEALCVEKLSVKIQELWGDRENIVRSVLDQENKKFQLHPGLKKYLQSCIPESDSTEILNSLRAFLVLSEKQNYKASLLDASFFILFFGQNKKIENLELQNVLKTNFSSEESLVEACVKLNKIYHNKLITLSVELSFSQENLEQLQQDVEKVLELLGNANL
jgi:hypothetical protein